MSHMNFINSLLLHLKPLRIQPIFWLTWLQREFMWESKFPFRINYNSKISSFFTLNYWLTIIRWCIIIWVFEIAVPAILKPFEFSKIEFSCQDCRFGRIGEVQPSPEIFDLWVSQKCHILLLHLLWLISFVEIWLTVSQYLNVAYMQEFRKLYNLTKFFKLMPHENIGKPCEQ